MKTRLHLLGSLENVECGALSESRFTLSDTRPAFTSGQKVAGSSPAGRASFLLDFIIVQSGCAGDPILHEHFNLVADK